MPLPSPNRNSPLEPYYIIVLKPQRTCVAWLVFSRRYVLWPRCTAPYYRWLSARHNHFQPPIFPNLPGWHWHDVRSTTPTLAASSLVCVQLQIGRYIVVWSRPIDAWRNEQTDGIRRNNDGIYLSRVSPLILAANTTLGVRWDLLLAALY